MAVKTKVYEPTMEERHALERHAASLEQMAQNALQYESERFWDRKTYTAFRQAARVLRKRLEVVNA